MYNTAATTEAGNQPVDQECEFLLLLPCLRHAPASRFGALSLWCKWREACWESKVWERSLAARTKREEREEGKKMCPVTETCLRRTPRRPGAASAAS